jgi:4-diphosphocytidyl-2-C-methyl-D-erythritol kinase
VITLKAAAKINLFLHVGDKRADGYHALESLAVFADVGDTLSFASADALSLSIEGPFAQGLSAEDNLVLKAARALGSHGAHITLTKNLPVASGIGGGSADAAAALRGLNELWRLGHATADLCAVAETLGSDVPVCVASTAAWMEGRGEILTPMRVSNMPILLVNPGVAVATADVFRALKLRSGLGRQKTAELTGTSNDLEAPAREIQPVIGPVLDAIAAQGARLARMSGSGATCFGLFDDDENTARAARALAQAHPAWWVRATRTL